MIKGRNKKVLEHLGVRVTICESTFDGAPVVEVLQPDLEITTCRIWTNEQLVFDGTPIIRKTCSMPVCH